MEHFVAVLELAGTVAFAASGALTAMKKKMDLLGILVLAVITAVGGGILRDLILGVTPPLAFRNPRNVLVAVGTALLLFLPFLRHRLMHNQRRFDAAMLLLDSLGLGVFTVMGIWNALQFDPDRSSFLLVLVGVLTGVGGGVVRDVLAGDTPYIFVKHIYACASLAGAVSMTALRGVLPIYASMLLSAVLVFVIRLLSAHFRWNLPRVRNL